MEIEDEGEVKVVLLVQEAAFLFYFLLIGRHRRHMFSLQRLHLSVTPCLALPERKKRNEECKGWRVGEID